MSSTKTPRRQLFVDPQVQGALLWRAVLYAFMCIVAMVLMLLSWRIVTGPARAFYYHFDDMWFFQGPALVAFLFILPVILLDLVRLTNRFAGPMIRLRRSMRALARGEHVEPIHFRDKDFWHDFAEEFNAVVAQVQGETTFEPIYVANTIGQSTVEPMPVGQAVPDNESAQPSETV
ncbi:MAG TPA: hypothetical protein VJL29_03415 [Thermoguttaceae bacterium]|nr:hypothetical protein [Thermoguttaceae bacterium]